MVCGRTLLYKISVECACVESREIFIIVIKPKIKNKTCTTVPPTGFVENMQ